MKKTYIRPALRVLHMAPAGPLAMSTNDKYSSQPAYAPQHDDAPEPSLWEAHCKRTSLWED